jgi:hypothetical protein
MPQQFLGKAIRLLGGELADSIPVPYHGSDDIIVTDYRVARPGALQSN